MPMEMATTMREWPLKHVRSITAMNMVSKKQLHIQIQLVPFCCKAICGDIPKSLVQHLFWVAAGVKLFGKEWEFFWSVGQKEWIKIFGTIHLDDLCHHHFWTKKYTVNFLNSHLDKFSIESHYLLNVGQSKDTCHFSLVRKCKWNGVTSIFKHPWK